MYKRKTSIDSFHHEGAETPVFAQKHTYSRLGLRDPLSLANIARRVISVHCLSRQVLVAQYLSILTRNCKVTASTPVATFELFPSISKSSSEKKKRKDIFL